MIEISEAPRTPSPEVDEKNLLLASTGSHEDIFDRQIEEEDEVFEEPGG